MLSPRPRSACTSTDACDSPFRNGPLDRLSDLEVITADWVQWYNTRRLMHHLGRIPPVEAEANYYAQARDGQPAVTRKRGCIKPGTLQDRQFVVYAAVHHGATNMTTKEADNDARTHHEVVPCSWQPGRWSHRAGKRHVTVINSPSSPDSTGPSDLAGYSDKELAHQE
jgi:hypothetical protein